MLDELPPNPTGGGLRIKIGIVWYTTINAVSTTVMLIIFAKSMVVCFNNLKSINGKLSFLFVQIKLEKQSM